MKRSEEEKALIRVRRDFVRGVREFSLVEPGDRVLLGLSGGKDSLALLELLAGMRRKYNRSFAVDALHVRMRGIDYLSDTDYLADVCRRNEVGFHVSEVAFPTDRNERRTPCFLCSWTRRKQLFATAQALGCNKLALGHHCDDILRTALMNLTFAGSFSTMPARLRMRKFPLTVVRPLCRVSEADLRVWAARSGYVPQQKNCPHERAGSRDGIGTVVEAMQALCPEARHHLWHALLKRGCLVQDEACAEAHDNADGL